MEEMRRVLAFFRTKATWWEQLPRQRENTDPVLFEGLSAYATKQAAVLLRLRHRFAILWRPHLQSFELSADWFLDDDLQSEPVTADSDSPAMLPVHLAAVD